MNFARSLFLNRIGGQISVIILVSLIAIHAVIVASLFIERHGQVPGLPAKRRRDLFPPSNWLPLPRRRAARSLARIAKAFPRPANGRGGGDAGGQGLGVRFRA